MARRVRARRPRPLVVSLSGAISATTPKRFRASGLEELAFESFFDDESPPVRRFRALYERPWT